MPVIKPESDLEAPENGVQTAVDAEPMSVRIKEEWAVLGALRFFLAMVVLCGHINTIIFMQSTTTWFYAIRQLGSVAAVLGFFVISGYSIASSIDQQPNGFYRRRALRVLPLFWAALLFSQSPWFLYGNWHPPGTTLAFVLNVLCLQTWITSPVANFNPSWSLACECFYYAFAPLLNKTAIKWLLVVTAISAILYLVHPYLSTVAFPNEQHGWPVLGLAWAWLVGFIYYKHRDKRWAGILLLALPVLLVVHDPFSFAPYSTTTLFITGAVIIFARDIRLPKRLSGLFNYLGEISYPLYLVHAPALVILSHYFPGMTRHHFVWIAAALAAAIIAYTVIDLPVRRFSRRGRLSRIPAKTSGPA